MMLLCTLLGHEWRELWSGHGNSKGAPISVCIRCRENGWRI